MLISGILIKADGITGAKQDRCIIKLAAKATNANEMSGICGWNSVKQNSPENHPGHFL
jgi:hypothetical protein